MTRHWNIWVNRLVLLHQQLQRVISIHLYKNIRNEIVQEKKNEREIPSLFIPFDSPVVPDEQSIAATSFTPSTCTGLWKNQFV